MQKASSQKKIKFPQCFTYEFFENNRYTISESDGYQALCNNGWIKLYTMPTRAYWHIQNQFHHRVQDWKLHISVQRDDLKKAWLLVGQLLINMKCRGGMKVVYMKQVEKSTKGRQITVYIMKFSDQFKKCQFAEQFGVNISQEHSSEFWIEMIKKIQQLLLKQNIKQNGLAEGDLKLGKYVSLRNEAFVKDQRGQYIYPPDQVGWNPLNHKLPIQLKDIDKSIGATSNILNYKKIIAWVFIPILISYISIYI